MPWLNAREPVSNSQAHLMALADACAGFDAIDRDCRQLVDQGEVPLLPSVRQIRSLSARFMTTAMI